MKKKDGWMKKTDSRNKALALKEIEKEFDFSKVERKVVTINLDSDIINYFKDLSIKTGKGYQVLIKDALKYFVKEGLQPQNVWKK